MYDCLEKKKKKKSYYDNVRVLENWNHMDIVTFPIEPMQYGFGCSRLAGEMYFFALAQTAPGLRTLTGWKAKGVKVQ